MQADTFPLDTYDFLDPARADPLLARGFPTAETVKVRPFSNTFAGVQTRIRPHLLPPQHRSSARIKRVKYVTRLDIFTTDLSLNEQLLINRRSLIVARDHFRNHPAIRFSLPCVFTFLPTPLPLLLLWNFEIRHGTNCSISRKSNSTVLSRTDFREVYRINFKELLFQKFPRISFRILSSVES